MRRFSAGSGGICSRNNTYDDLIFFLIAYEDQLPNKTINKALSTMWNLTTRNLRILTIQAELVFALIGFKILCLTAASNGQR